MENFKFHNDALILKCYQKSLNSFCFGSLASAFASIDQTKAANAISLHITPPLKSKMGNSIDFANDISKNERKLKANQECIIARGNIKCGFL